MKISLKIFLATLLAILTFGNIIRSEVRYHCDSEKEHITKLIEASSKGENIGERVLLAAKSLIGTPIGPVADNDSVGTIKVRLDSLDRASFIDMSIAAAQASLMTSPSIKDFENKLEGVSRRKGKDEGFPSQFHYVSDWIVDNVYRGNVKEMTEYLESGNYKTKTLDRVSRNKEQYPALKDSSVLDRIKVIEMGFRSHRIPHLKKQSVGNKALQQHFQNGDIIILLPPDPDYDVYDMGIVEVKDGVPYLIHPSMQSGSIIEDEYPLQRLFKLEGQYFYGFRWLRPVE